MIRIIARRSPWKSRLRWDALTEDGDLLFAATEYPLADGAYVLMSNGIDPEALVTMRHEGADIDSFVPMPLRIPAAQGAKRAEGRARIASMRPMHRTEAAISDPEVGRDG